MYRRRGRPSLRERAQLAQDRARSPEMPEQAEPSAPPEVIAPPVVEQRARPEASASPDLSAQLAALTEVTRRQGELLERMCESAMEKLFEDLFIPEGEQVPLGVHYLAGDAHDWWRRARRDQGLVAAQLRWDEFCGILYGMYFPNSMKQKIEEDLKRIQQGERTVQEYVREFTRLLNCVPFVARDEAHRVYLFEQGLRPDLFRFVRAQRSRTLDASIEQALWEERGEVSLRERTQAVGQSQDRKRPFPNDGGQSSSRRPPRPPRSRSQGRGFSGRQRSSDSRQRGSQRGRRSV
uniref:Retrotransposon gag domain-containing protein n=1 Tax=Ananas comosus var. bracteatus TaxID=296719 RepID=A0A6V7QC22_ANACO|nr:unnamed protein product [Ananas comosus var. bracteatus]